MEHWSEFKKYENAFKWIVENKPKLIVEYGGGSSTKWINQLLDELDYGGKVIAYENNPEWLEYANNKGENEHGSIRLAQIEVVNRDKGYVRYVHPIEDVEEVDLVIIDGPDYRVFLDTRGHPSNATDNLELIVNHLGREVPYFIDSRTGVVEYYKRLGYTTHIKQ
jgi:hypothetical protein